MSEMEVALDDIRSWPGVAEVTFGPHPYAPGCRGMVITTENGYDISIISGWISMGEVEVAVIGPGGRGGNGLIWMEEWNDEVRRGWTPDTLRSFIREVIAWKDRRLPSKAN